MTLRYLASPSVGTLIAGKFALPHGVTDRFAEVTYLDGHSDALCFVDVTGARILGELVGWRLMTEGEIIEWESFGKVIIDVEGFEMREAS